MTNKQQVIIGKCTKSGKDAYTEIIINYYEDLNSFNQIVFIIDGFIQTVEYFELKHHAEYLNLDITKFAKIKN